MNMIRRHVPNFVDAGGGDEPAAFETVADLEAIPWLASWRSTPGFSRFSVSTDGPLLMAEMQDGSYWVAGYLAGDVPELPRWSEQ